MCINQFCQILNCQIIALVHCHFMDNSNRTHSTSLLPLCLHSSCSPFLSIPSHLTLLFPSLTPSFFFSSLLFLPSTCLHHGFPSHLSSQTINLHSHSWFSDCHSSHTLKPISTSRCIQSQNHSCQTILCPSECFNSISISNPYSRTCSTIISHSTT